MEEYKSIVALENEALIALSEKRYREAILAHGRALTIAQDLNRPKLMAALFNRMGRALEADGEIQDAVIAYESGLRALSTDEVLDLQEVLMSLGAVAKGYGGPGDPVAPDLYREEVAQDLTTAEADPTLPAKLLINVGNAYLQQPQEAPALNAYQQALARPEIDQAPELRAHALTHIGIILRRRGEIDAAEAKLDEALRLFEAHADGLEKRRALGALAGIYRDRGQADQALDTYRQALALYAEADDPLGEGRAQAGLGHLLLEQERFAEAQQAFQRAVDLASTENDDTTLWHAYWGLGRCQQEAGDLDEAATALRRSLNLISRRQRELRTDEGKVTFLDSVQDVYDELISLHLERARNDEAVYADALAVAEEARGRALRDLMGGRERRRPSGEEEYRPSRFRPFDERFPPWAQMAPGMPSSPPDFNIASQMAPGIESAAGMWEEPLAEEAEPATESQEVPNPPPLARLVFHVLADRTAVLAVTPEGAVHGHVLDFGQDALSQRVAELRQALRVDDEPRGVRLTRDARRFAPAGPPADPKPLLRELYDELIAPIAGVLPTDGTPVVVEPHGALWLLPFAALLGPDETWLVDRWPLLYSPSAQVLDEIRREPDYGGPTDLKALIVGNPAMPKVPSHAGLGIELKPLPGAEQEAKTIAGMFPEERRTLLLGADAAQSAVEDRLSEYGILHLATHGIAYADDPLASFVALADSEAGAGLLTARRVTTSLTLPADLVALSACQTGLGKVSGDGMIGLSRAFLVAGARAVLVSQWNVSDEATAELMAAFYRGYIKVDDKAIALQRAMRELRAHSGYAHPRYWAPFVVVGAEA